MLDAESVAGTTIYVYFLSKNFTNNLEQSLFGQAKFLPVNVSWMFSGFLTGPNGGLIKVM